MTPERAADLMATQREWELPRVNAAAGVDDPWVQAFLAVRLADLLAQVAIGERLKSLPPLERAWFHRLAEWTVEHAVLRYQDFQDEV